MGIGLDRNGRIEITVRLIVVAESKLREGIGLDSRGRIDGSG